MSGAVLRFTLTGAMLTTAALASAQQVTTKETKAFEVISVEGNNLVVKLPEGTKELTVPEDFRFVVDGQQKSVHELKAGMKGTAQITTTTTSHPVTVTEVKNGTVRFVTPANIIVQTDQGFKSFTQDEVNKRGVKIVKDGQPAEISDFKVGDVLSATIITSKPPRIVTEKQVQATLARNAGGGGSSRMTATNAASGSSGSSGSAASKSALSSSQASGGQAAAPGSSGRKLPKTASQLPLVGLGGLASLVIGIALTIRRRSFAR